MVFDDIILEDYARNKLKKLYDDCLMECNSKPGNLIVDLISKKSNERSVILKESSIQSKYVDSETIESLIEHGLVSGLNNSERITITVRGILYIESLDNDQYISELADAIQSKYLDIFNTGAPTARNRIVLLTMVTMRCFSEETAIDLRTSTGDAESWWSILQEVSEFMVEMGSVEEANSLREYRSKSGTEDPASNVIRHSDKLPRQTDNIFSKSGKNQYWLSVEKGDGIDLDKLAMVIRLSLGKKLDKNNYTKYANWCNKKCLLRGPDIKYTVKDDRYLSMDYNDTIKEAFEKASYFNIH